MLGVQAKQEAEARRQAEEAVQQKAMGGYGGGYGMGAAGMGAAGMGGMMGAGMGGMMGANGMGGMMGAGMGGMGGPIGSMGAGGMVNFAGGMVRGSHSTIVVCVPHVLRHRGAWALQATAWVLQALLGSSRALLVAWVVAVG